MKKTTLNILSLFVIAVLLVFSFASCKSSKQCDSSYNNETRNDNLSAEPPPLQRRQRSLTTEPKQKQINPKLPIFRLPLWQMHFLSETPER